MSFLDQALLRIPCDPDERVARDLHKHQCAKCATTWAHPDELNAFGITHREHELAHECPKCGEEQYNKLRPPGGWPYEGGWDPHTMWEVSYGC